MRHSLSPPLPLLSFLLSACFFGAGPLACSGDGNETNSSGESSSATGNGTDSGMDGSGGDATATGGGKNGSATGGESSVSEGTGGSAQGTGGGPGSTEGSASALVALEQWLTDAPPERSRLDEEDFAATPLSADDADSARDLLWEDLAAQIEASRRSEVDQKSITIDEFTLDYETVLLGNEPEGGRSLFISMHGGGSAPKATNDEQWQNQIVLAQSYAPEDALWVAPRAPTDDWNMWFKDHIVPLFDRLISNMIVFEGINPNKVYLTGYSAGGDGVYQLGPTLADRWAGAAMSAGHPNDMTPANLRNIPFAIHVGGDDTAFDRNLVAAQWGEQLADLQAADPDGYPHQVQVHAGLPHWMNLADQPSVPFIQSYERNIYPSRVVWKQSTLLQTRFYWLKIPAEQAVKDRQLVASVNGQTITLDGDAEGELTLLLSDEMLDLDQEVSVTLNGQTTFNGMVSRTILALYESLAEREDPAATFDAALVLDP